MATCPGGASQSVVVHQLSKRSSQNPFRKNKGKVTNCAFHPTQPLLLVASETNVKVYNLVRQALTKTLLAGGGVITAMHIHPSGDHVLVGTEDKRCLWCAAPRAETPLPKRKRKKTKTPFGDCSDDFVCLCALLF